MRTCHISFRYHYICVCAWQAASGELDRAVSLGKKRLDLLQYQNRQRMEKLGQMEGLINQRQKELDAVQAQEEGESEEARQLHELENQLMQLDMRYREARHLHTMYQKIVDRLSEVSQKWKKSKESETVQVYTFWCFVLCKVVTFEFYLMFIISAKEIS